MTLVVCLTAIIFYITCPMTCYSSNRADFSSHAPLLAWWAISVCKTILIYWEFGKLCLHLKFLSEINNLHAFCENAEKEYIPLLLYNQCSHDQLSYNYLTT